MPELPRTKFDPEWVVATIQAELNGVKNARGSESLSDVLDAKAENATVAAAVAELSAGIGAVANAGAKNHLMLTESSGTTSGVDWTVDPTTGIVTATRVTGTSDSFRRFSEQTLKPGTYILTSYPNASFSTADSYITSGGTTIARDVDGFQTFTVTQDITIYLYCRIRSGVTEAEFRPMIRRAEIKDDTFVPYAPSNRELYEMILALQGGGNRALMMQTLQPTDSEEQEER